MAEQYAKVIRNKNKYGHKEDVNITRPLEFSRTMPSSPYISVIVTAHDRRQYLPEALHSLESQTLNKDMFEVIVVKNFEDPKSDEIIKRNDWKDVVIPGQTDLIQKAIAGLNESRGDVITFLEDDDLYAPERLAYIYLAFKNIKGLIWFHNLQYYIDESGSPIFEDSQIRRLTGGAQPRFPLILKSDDRTWLRLIPMYSGLHHNNSSIAVARHIVERLRGLRGIASDLAMTVIAGLSDGLLYHTAKRLTYFRVHRGNTSQTKKGYINIFLTIFKLLERYKMECAVNNLLRKPFCILLYTHLGCLYPVSRAIAGSFTLANYMEYLLIYGVLANSFRNLVNPVGLLKLAYWPIKERKIGAKVDVILSNCLRSI